MQIEFNGDVYDVNVTSATEHVAATFHDPAEGGEIEFDLELDGIEIESNLFTDSEWSEIDSLVFEKLEKEASDARDECMAEQRMSDDDFY